LRHSVKPPSAIIKVVCDFDFADDIELTDYSWLC